MTFLEALSTDRPMRQASWVDGLWIRYSNERSRWEWTTNGTNWHPFMLDTQQVLTPRTMLATDWEVQK